MVLLIKGLVDLAAVARCSNSTTYVQVRTPLCVCLGRTHELHIQGRYRRAPPRRNPRTVDVPRVPEKPALAMFSPTVAIAFTVLPPRGELINSPLRGGSSD